MMHIASDESIRVERIWKRDQSTNIMNLREAVSAARTALKLKSRHLLRRRLLRGEIVETPHAFFRALT